jgi:hypothetical protein
LSDTPGLLGSHRVDRGGFVPPARKRTTEENRAHRAAVAEVAAKAPITARCALCPARWRGRAEDVLPLQRAHAVKEHGADARRVYSPRGKAAGRPTGKIRLPFQERLDADLAAAGT